MRDYRSVDRFRSSSSLLTDPPTLASPPGSPPLGGRSLPPGTSFGPPAHGGTARGRSVVLEAALTAVQRFIQGETDAPFCVARECYEPVDREGDICERHTGCVACERGWFPG